MTAPCYNHAGANWKLREVKHGTDRNHRHNQKPADANRFWEGTFLVDTGAIDCVVPRSVLEGVGLRPKGERVYTLADGSEVRMDVTTCDVEILGEIAGATIVFADDDNAIPLLGVTAMESAGIEVDSRNERLRRLPSISLR